MISDSNAASSNTSQPAAETARSVQPRRFTDKVAVITGVSDRGIGGAIAERLAREGASVAMLCRHEPHKLLKLLDRLECDARSINCDITQSSQITAAVEWTVDQLGGLEILVNNAGVESAGRLEEVPIEKWKALLDVNLQGAIQMSQSVLPVMKSGGVIVNVASTLSIGGCAGYSVYSASNAGLIGFTQSLAWELAPRGIRVVADSPGLIHTPMVFKHIARWTPEARDKVEACHPLGIGTPHDVANAVAFLASSEGHWITGVNLPLGWAPHYPLPFQHFLG